MLKKRYLYTLLVLFFAVSTGILFADFDGKQINADLNATEKPDHILLTWSGNPMTTQTISWRSSIRVENGLIKFREADNSNAVYKTIGASVKKFTAVYGDSTGSFNLFSVTLTGLKPGTQYEYIAVSGNIESPLLHFTTEPENTDSFKFLIFGDSQSGEADNPNYAPWHETITKAYARNPDARFLINMGDLVEVGQDYIHWNNWFDAAKDVIENIPEMTVEGNHETYLVSPANDSSKPIYFTEQFPVFQDGPDGLKGQVYSYDYENAHIIVLDSQEDEESPKYGDILSNQAEWLDNDLSSAKADWKLVFFHKTPYYNKGARANEVVKAIFCPVIEKYHVDIVFNGHDHTLSRTFPIKNNKFYSSPKDGTVYYVTGRSGAKYYSDLTQKIWDAYFYDPQDQPCYEFVSVQKNVLTIKAFKQDGTLIDSYTIDKQNDSNSSLTPAPFRFNIVRAAVYGNFLIGQSINSPSITKNTNGEWYIDVSPFMNYIGGSIAVSNNKEYLILKDKTLEVPADKVQVNSKKITLVSAGALKSLLGFNFSYNEFLNVIEFVK